MPRHSLKAALKSGVKEAIIRTETGFASNVQSYDGHPLPLERAFHILARLLETETDPDYVSISWKSQERAAALASDLPTALREILKRDPTALDTVE
jgi:hypothetical protein